MPNALAYIALFGWPLIAIYLFSTLKFERAVIWSVVAPLLFLPSGFGVDLPGVPPLDKHAISGLTVLILAAVYGKSRFRLLPAGIGAKLLLLLLFGGALLTYMTNQDPVRINDILSLRGLAIHDAFSNMVRKLILVAPFLIGCQYLTNPRAHRDLLKALFFSGCLYSVLMLYEIRMSPQLHTMLYGYFPHSFAQQVRQGGFRPVVFMQHGLWVAFFGMTMAVAAAALWRQSFLERARLDEIQNRVIYLYAIPYFAVVLVLCKSLGSLLLGLISVPLVLFTKPRTQLHIAAIFVMIAMMYPTLRGAHLVPLDDILSAAHSIDTARAESLQTRITNEERLLRHAEQRPWFGWGSWGRNRVFDPESGRDITIVDGRWIGQLSSGGWVTFIAVFGLLGFPVLVLWYQSWRGSVDPPDPATAALALLVAINMVELLPNSTLPTWTWLMAGALLSYALQKKPATAAPAEPQKPTRPRTVL